MQIRSTLTRRESHPRRWLRRLLASGLVLLVLAGAVGLRWWRHPPYRARRPQIRVTLAGGCPHSLGVARDVTNPGAPSLVLRFFHDPPLAATGATGGLVCRYATGVGTGATLSSELRLTPGQAGAVSGAAARMNTGYRPHGETSCPGDPGQVVVLVLGYAHRADIDLWWHDGGCASVDNGYADAEGYPANASYFGFAAAVPMG